MIPRLYCVRSPLPLFPSLPLPCSRCFSCRPISANIALSRPIPAPSPHPYFFNFPCHQQLLAAPNPATAGEGPSAINQSFFASHCKVLQGGASHCKPLPV